MLRYSKLLNPLTTIRYTGEGDEAPKGKFALSHDPKTNLALWNTLGVGAWAVPATAVAAYLAKKYWEDKLESEVVNRTAGKVNALRPQFTPDADLSNTSNITDIPNLEARAARAVEKRASEGDSLIGDGLKRSAVSILPMLALPGFTLATAAVLHNKFKKDYKNKLLEERVALRNMQNKIDHDMLQEAGMVKGASADYDKQNLLRMLMMDIPLAGVVGMSGLLSAAALKHLMSRDENIDKLKFLKKKVLGANVLQETPQASLTALPADVSGLVARTGDKTPTMLLETAKKTPAISQAIDPADMLEEVGGAGI